MDFPIFNSKELSKSDSKYNLSDFIDRQKYFEEKLGQKIEDLKVYLDNNSFVAFVVGKKNSGKGTYIKMFQEIVGKDRAHHLSIGDIVRSTFSGLENEVYSNDLTSYIEKNYRGFLKPQEVITAILNKSQDKLIPTDVILILLKREVEKLSKKALFIDGLPRDLDQIGVSLFFREIINYRDDPDFFVLFSVPESVLAVRMFGRNVCPMCGTPRDLALNPSKFVVYDKFTDKFKMLCDNKDCQGFNKQVLVKKEGDDKGLESIRDRLDKDLILLEQVNELSGIAKIVIRNDIPLDRYKEFVDEYEVTSQYSYEDVNGKVNVSQGPWVIKNDQGEDSVSIMTAAGVVSMASQIHNILFS